ncbi:uncharacterized protein F54H12.2-like [Brevipalpus obovatus]|uniref:uncharacterized protein F54H12.2-like n=1 Tax=Brevipalpus obovatus TaxID=246614 RepID=UPI003D9DE2F8
MSLIHPLSSSAMLSELDLFGVPPTQLSVERGYETEHRPVSSLSSSTPIEFIITSCQDEYIMFSESYLMLKFRLCDLVKKDNEVIEGDVWPHISFSQNLLGSMFESCKVAIGNKEITFSSGNYAWRSYIETILGYGHESKLSFLTCNGYFADHLLKDKFKKSYEPGANDNKTKSKSICLLGKLNMDLTFQEKAMIGGADIRIQLVPNAPRFYVKSTKAVTFNVEFESCSFVAYRIKATPEMVHAHTKALMISPMKYPITRVEVKYISVGQGLADANLDNIVIGQLPRRVIIGMVTRDSFHGYSTDDPFEFKNFGVKFLSLNADGVQYPSRPYTPNFGADEYLREYYGLFQALNQNVTSSTITMDRFKYKESTTLFGFNLTPDLSSGGQHLNPIKRGALNLALRFNSPLEQPIVVVAYCEFDNLIQIAADRSVATDYI